MSTNSNSESEKDIRIRVLTEQGELVPKYIPEVTFLSMVAEDCFMNNRTGNDVEKVRKGLKILKETGVLN